MPTLKLPTGIEMAYTERGSGEPLICIMGVTTVAWAARTNPLVPTPRK